MGLKNMKITLSKKQWELIGKKTGWMKESQIIPSDGIADGGEPYTDEEMDLMVLDDIKKNNNRPEKIKQIIEFYVKKHSGCSEYEINTVWSDIGQKSLQEINQYLDKYATKWANGIK